VANASVSPLRALAVRFEPLSAAEERLIDLAPTGDEVDCKQLAGEIRAEIVRWLCLEPKAAGLLAPGGILLSSATVSGALDLSFGRIGFPLALIECSLPGIQLRYAELKAVSLGKSDVGRVDAVGLSVTDDLLMRGIHAARGVDLRNAHVGGNLDLDDANLSAAPTPADKPGGPAVWAENASVGGNATLRTATVVGCVDFMNASIGGNFECGDARIVAPQPRWTNALWLERAKVSGHVLLRRAPDSTRKLQIEGQVNLLGLAVGGNLECDGATLDNGKGEALLAEGLRVSGSVFLRQGFVATGGVHLLLAQIDGNLDCEGASLKRPPGRALAADGAKIGGVLTLGPDFASEGGVSFTAATIGVSVTCVGSFRADDGDDALSLASATVGGQVVLGDGFESFGTVRLVAARIGGDLSIHGARLIHPEGVALGADAARIAGSVSIGPTVVAEGTVRFHSAKIELHFTCNGSELACPAGDALLLQGIGIQGNLSLGQGFRPVGVVDIELANIGTMLSISGADLAAAELKLSATYAGALEDEPSHWPAPGKLNLDGFTYDRLLAAPFDAEGRLKWLRLQIPPGATRGDSLRLQPYQQIAKVLGEQGYDDATDVLVGLQDDRRRYGGLGWPARVGLAVLKFTTGYGYRPSRAIWCIAGFILASYLIFGAAWQSGEIVPTTDEALTALKRRAPSASYESFCALTYATDVFVPIIDLGQRSQWHPVASDKDAMAPVAAPGGLLCEGPPLAAIGLAPAVWVVRVLRWVDIGAGWLLSGLLGAAAANLVRKS